MRVSAMWSIKIKDGAEVSNVSVHISTVIYLCVRKSTLICADACCTGVMMHMFVHCSKMIPFIFVCLMI